MPAFRTPLAAGFAAVALFCMASPPAACASTSDFFSQVAYNASAVTGLGPDVRLQVTELYGDRVSIRILSAGAEYADGWRVAAVMPASVTLRKGASARTVALQPKSPAEVANRTRLDMAIARKDMAQVIALSGSADDINKASPTPDPSPAEGYGVRTINLRNLGNGRTLVLFDGVRLADPPAPPPQPAP